MLVGGHGCTGYTGMVTLAGRGLSLATCRGSPSENVLFVFEAVPSLVQGSTLTGLVDPSRCAGHLLPVFLCGRP